jgi:hypothetical protein
MHKHDAMFSERPVDEPDGHGEIDQKIGVIYVFHGDAQVRYARLGEFARDLVMTDRNNMGNPSFAQRSRGFGSAEAVARKGSDF